MKGKLHYRRGNAPACGAWGDGLLLTEDRKRVTCGNCRRALRWIGTPRKRGH